MVLRIRKIIFIGHSFLPRFATYVITKNENFFECQNLASKRQPTQPRSARRGCDSLRRVPRQGGIATFSGKRPGLELVPSKRHYLVPSTSHYQGATQYPEGMMTPAAGCFNRRNNNIELAIKTSRVRDYEEIQQTRSEIVSDLGCRLCRTSASFF